MWDAATLEVSYMLRLPLYDTVLNSTQTSVEILGPEGFQKIKPVVDMFKVDACI